MRMFRQGLKKSLLCVGLTLALLFLTTPSQKPNRRLEKRDRINLLVGKRVLDDFRKKWRDLPTDMNELRAYARSIHSQFSIYDSTNQRLEYMRLSMADYILRSHYANRGEYVTNWQVREKNLPIYDYINKKDHVFYPTALLTGSRSGDKQWHSQVFVDNYTGKRQLVVRKAGENTRGIMVARHDHVEEFVWLPSQQDVVYTASGSARYQDGLYLWNVVTGEQQEILTAFAAKLPRELRSPTGNYYLSLSRVNQDGKKFYAFVKPRVPGRDLEPTSFFHRANYYEINLEKKQVFLARENVPVQDLDIKYWRESTKANLYLEDWQELPLIFTSWTNLSLQGEWFDVLNAWHEKTDRFSPSPLWPYYLWVLCSLYADAAEKVEVYEKDEAKILRSFAVEIARVLATLPEAPTYLSGYGMFVFNTLVDGRDLSYQLSRLEVDPTRLAKAREQKYRDAIRKSP